MYEPLIFFTVGLLGLWVGSDFLIRGVKSIAERFGLPHFFIGLAIVSVGTSIPEIAVSVAGGLDRLAGLETSGIVVGNAIGSSLSQISLLFGILAFLVPLQLKRGIAFKYGGFLIASVLLVFGLAYDGYLSKWDGWIAIGAYTLFYLFLISTINHSKRTLHPKTHIVQDIVYVILGLALVLYTSDIVVTNGVLLADLWGVSQSLVGVLLISIGTGLPELSVAIASFRQKAMGISMGDLIGSNICDLLLSLGAGTVISGFVVDPILLWFDIPVLLMLSFLIVTFWYTGRKISRFEGVFLLIIYGIYAYTRIFVTG